MSICSNFLNSITAVSTSCVLIAVLFACSEPFLNIPPLFQFLRGSPTGFQVSTTLAGVYVTVSVRATLEVNLSRVNLLATHNLLPDCMSG